MLDNHSGYGYETPYKGPFLITQCCTNDMVTLQYGATKIRYNTCRIKPHTSDTNVEDIKFWKIIIDGVTLGNHQLYYYVFTLKIGKRYINWIHTGTSSKIHIHLIDVHLWIFLMTMSFSLHQDAPQVTR